jgi:hypothetical protein
MTILTNAECHFVGINQPIAGGKEFFTSLVTAVSHYAQEFLSGIRHDQSHQSTALVKLERGESQHVHQLTALSATSVDTGEGSGMLVSNEPKAIKLNTIQLFDLVEAVDQFLADGRTLPDIALPLSPVKKAYGKELVKQATPAGIGVTSLAIAAVSMSLLPMPKIAPPNPTEKNPTTETSPNPKDGSAGTPIADPTQIGFLQRKLYRDLNQNWRDRKKITQKTEYRVSVNGDGQIVGYKNLTGVTGNDELTPLPSLRVVPPSGSSPSPVPLADFKVVFTNGGILELAPSSGLTGKPTLGKLLEDRSLIKTLQGKLQENLKGLNTSPINYKRDLTYRVALNQSGEIVDYQPTNSGGYDFEASTPLPQQVKFSPQVAAGIEAIAQFEVTFKPNGEVEVKSK